MAGESIISSKWEGPGLIQTFITRPRSSKLSQEILEKWLDEVYIPALLDTGTVVSSWRHQAANPAYEKQILLMHKVSDLAPVQAGKLQSISRTSDLFPTDEPVDAFIESDSRILSFVQHYQTTEHPEDAGTTIIYASMEPKPGQEADLDAWYREEHNQQMSEQPGWKRTVRFKLLFQHRDPSDKGSQAASFLAIHEFGEGHKLKKDVEPVDPMTDWTKRCMGECKFIDAAIFNKVKTFGRAEKESS